MKKIIFLILIITQSIVLSCCNITIKDSFNDKKTEPLIISDISYNNISGFKNEIYIKENDEYIPYIVLTDDYNDSNVLLIRKNVVSEKMSFNNKNSKLHYYPESDIDNYLNNKFINVYSEKLQENILETPIEVTSKEVVELSNHKRKTELINRKLFLLSATEYGIKNNMATTEGKKIEGLEKYLTKDVEWLRSAYLWEYYLVWTISSENIASEYENNLAYIRPAFTVAKDLEIQKTSKIIEGESTYVIKLEY